MATGRARVAYLLVFAAVVIIFTIGEPLWVRAVLGAVAVAPVIVADTVMVRGRATGGTARGRSAQHGGQAGARSTVAHPRTPRA